MSTTALDTKAQAMARGEASPTASTIGMKVVMAVTGFILWGFVVVHLLGNLQVYQGPEALNHYAAFLRTGTHGLVWVIRAVLLLSVLLHLWSASRLQIIKEKARPIPYRKKGVVQATLASRTMIWGGVLIAAFVIFHILHLTTGTAHPRFSEHDVYANVVYGFRQVPVSIAYIVAMMALGMHLYHGLWSMFQSVGLAHPRYTPGYKKFAIFFAVLIVAGNISIPIAVMSGLVGGNP